MNTLKSLRRFSSMSLAVVMSIYQSSVTISGYSLPISWQIFRNLPSVVLTTLALVMMETLLLVVISGVHRASLAMRSVPWVVVTVKSKARSSSTLRPQEPRV